MTPTDKLLTKPYLLGHLLGFKDLTRLHNQWIKDMWTHPRAAALMASRDTFKTSAIIITGIIWQLLLLPEQSIMLNRKTFTDSAKIMRAIISLLETAEVKALFREYQGKGWGLKEASDKRIFMNTKRADPAAGNVEGYGIGDSKTGTHFDVILNDDIITEKDRYSAAEREHTLRALQEQINIAKPEAKLLYTGTPWDKKDSWGWIEATVKNRGGQVYKYPARDIWEMLFSPESLEERRAALSPYLFSANYELEYINDESLLFQNPIQESMQPSDFTGGIAHIDAAYGGNDTTAFSIIKENRVFGKLWKNHVDHHIGEIVELCARYGIRRGYCELNADKGYLKDKINKMGGVQFEGYHETQNKTLKILTYVYEAWPNLVFSTDTDSGYILQITDWYEGTTAHDDAPDNLASILRQQKDGVSFTEWKPTGGSFQFI